MAGLNKVILIGNVGRAPDTYQFDDGTKKISFPLATTESYRDRNSSEWKEITEWHNVVGYRYLAERNIAKGDMLFVEGKIKSRKYTDRDGNEKYITEIIADKFNILVRSQAGDERQPMHNSPDTENLDSGDPQDESGDLPF
jgi:single-strand DNA-binding protein